MFKIIRLSRFKFDKGIIQHNVAMSVSGLFDDETKMVEARINIMTTLLESLFPATITISSILRNAHPLMDFSKKSPRQFDGYLYRWGMNCSYQ